MKVCFIDPQGATSDGPNVGIAYICSYLAKHTDCEKIRVFDFHNTPFGYEEKIRNISGYDIVGVSIKSFSLGRAAKIIREIRPLNKLVVAGGIHVSIDGMSFMKDYPEVDIGVTREGEETMVELVDYLRGKKKLEEIQGILYRKNGEVVMNPERPYIENLEELPYPGFEYFDTIDVSKGLQRYFLSTSRGCPFFCSFCVCGQALGRKWRHRAPEDVVKEIRYAIEKYKPEEICVVDDVFSLDVKRAKEICRLWLKEGLKVSLNLFSGIRADEVDEELLLLLKQCGVHNLSFGIESGHPEVFKQLKKGETLEEIERAVALAKEADLLVKASFIIGLPGATRERDEKSLELAMRLDLDKVTWSMLVPFPFSSSYEWVQTHGRAIRGWRNTSFCFNEIDTGIVAFETEDYKAQERIEMFIKASIKTFNYTRLFNQNASLLHNAITVFFLILKYDLSNLGKHIMHVIAFRKPALRYIKRWKVRPKHPSVEPACDVM